MMIRTDLLKVEGRASSIPLAPAIIPQDEESALEER